MVGGTHLRRSRAGFTLIELLVVISIIALLAGLIVGLMPRAMQDKREKLIRAQLATLVTVLESYKKKHGFYPPDNATDPTRPPLLYEVTGTVTEDGETYFAFDDFDESRPITRAGDLNAYGIDGLLNSDESLRAVKNFYPGIQSSQIKLDPVPPGSTSGLRFLVVPADDPDGKQFNPWRYISQDAPNNPKSFDLWAEYKDGNNMRVIGNWPE